MRSSDARSHLERQTAAAGRALGWERAIVLALPALAVAALWAAAAMAGLGAWLGPLGSSLAAIAALLALTALALRASRRWRPATTDEARRRLERDNGLDQGLLASLEDQPARLEPASMALWRRAQAQAHARAAEARARRPRPQWRDADPLGLRFVAVAALAGGAVIAGEDAPGRLAAAFVPQIGPLVGDRPLALEAWASPAPYTGAAPVPLSERVGERVDTPPSVEVTVRVSGPVGAPVLRFRGAPDGKEHGLLAEIFGGWFLGERIEVRLNPTPDGAWEGKLALPSGGTVSLHRFGEQARWTVRPAPDAAPVAAFLEGPAIAAESATGAVRFRWEASDDYGVRSVALRLTPVDPPPGLVGAPPADVPLDPTGAEPRQAQGAVEVDLLAHAYAGMTVDAQLVAKDAIGQEGASAPVRLTLPAPILLQPLAQAAIEIRREILHERRPYAGQVKPDDPAPVLWVPDAVFGARPLEIRTAGNAPRMLRAPPGVLRAARMLDAVTLAPDEGFFPDLAVYLGLESAAASLREASTIEETDAAADLLWHVAQRAEFGDSADARTALEQAQRALSEAMARGAPPEEIARLSQAVREAMQRYLTALVEEALREGRVDQGDETREQASMSRSDLDELMREVERLAREGRTEEAQALLNQLTQMLADMEVRLTAGPGGENTDPESQRLDEALRDLSDAVGEQRALRDQTQAQGRGEQGQDGATAGQGLADRQERLQRDLEGVQRQAQGQDGAEGGQAGQEALDRAGDAMREAERALRRGDFGEAERAQDRALENLRAGSEALSRELLSRQDERRGERETGDGVERDPLGRPSGAAGLGDGEDVGVPDGMERQRAREIRDELRRRAQDPRRPESEREYLRRLLDRFTGS